METLDLRGSDSCQISKFMHMCVMVEFALEVYWSTPSKKFGYSYFEIKSWVPSFFNIKCHVVRGFYDAVSLSNKMNTVSISFGFFCSSNCSNKWWGIITTCGFPNIQLEVQLERGRFSIAVTEASERKLVPRSTFCNDVSSQICIGEISSFIKYV